ncbi:lysozyme [Providencia huaxiensis]|uniref:lysozyme n=1 Tax=Providencia huaxiensis TaxID=2027290 RepID=UPI001B36AEF6|nr:lysozyme [Providencia huaxiensis]EIL1981255.1 lysozyme [Providencia rettgeri]EIU9514026.1 lysozyme [Providencia rettgeri]ELR5094079.1 lysozyme [Providencia rettgeri]MBQ0533450.1 lysozyme [Providencia huaxiensis]MBQ0587007.1 lysozyme [Providencia huaxiensis]
MSLKQKLTVLIGAGASAIALTVIAHFEGVRYEPYEDVGGVLTVCYGHTGIDIVPNKTYTKEECDEILELDFELTKMQVDRLVKVPINDYTKAALYSFAFNVGTNAFARSTMLKKLNAGDQYGACEELKKWVYVKNKVWRGLVNRREAEAAICHGNL